MTLDSFTQRKSTNVDKSLIANVTILMCATDFRPFAMIEGRGMKRLIQTIMKIGSQKGMLNVDQVVPSAETLRRNLDPQYGSMEIKHISPVAVQINSDIYGQRFGGAYAAGHELYTLIAIIFNVDPMLYTSLAIFSIGNTPLAFFTDTPKVLVWIAIVNLGAGLSAIILVSPSLMQQ